MILAIYHTIMKFIIKLMVGLFIIKFSPQENIFKSSPQENIFKSSLLCINCKQKFKYET